MVARAKDKKKKSTSKSKSKSKNKNKKKSDPPPTSIKLHKGRIIIGEENVKPLSSKEKLAIQNQTRTIQEKLAQFRHPKLVKIARAAMLAQDLVHIELQNIFTDKCIETYFRKKQIQAHKLWLAQKKSISKKQQDNAKLVLELKQYNDPEYAEQISLKLAEIEAEEIALLRAFATRYQQYLKRTEDLVKQPLQAVQFESPLKLRLNKYNAALEAITELFPTQPYKYFPRKKAKKKHSILIFPTQQHEQMFKQRIALQKQQIAEQIHDSRPQEIFSPLELASNSTDFTLMNVPALPWSDIVSPNSHLRFPQLTAPYPPVPLPRPIDDLSNEDIAQSDFWAPGPLYDAFPRTAWLLHPGELRPLLMLPIIGPPLPPDYLVHSHAQFPLERSTETETDLNAFSIRNYTTYNPARSHYTTIKNIRDHKISKIHSPIQRSFEINSFMNFSINYLKRTKKPFMYQNILQNNTLLNNLIDGKNKTNQTNFDSGLLQYITTQPLSFPQSTIPQSDNLTITNPVLLSTLPEIHLGILSPQPVYPHPHSLATLRELFELPTLLHSFTKSLRVPKTLLTSHGISTRSTLNSTQRQLLQGQNHPCQSEFSTYSNCLNSAGAFAHSLCLGQFSLYLSCRNSK